MKKIVFESLYDYQKSGSKLNELDFKKAWGKAKSTVSDIADKISLGFKKAGDFFVGLFDGEPVEGVMLPINVGVMVDKNILDPKIISYIPSPEDQELDPSLPIPSVEDLAEKRTHKEDDPNGSPDDSIEDVLASLAARSENMNESFKSKKTKRKVNEGKVPLKHPGGVVNVNTPELLEEIEMAIRMGEDSKLIIWGGPGIGKTQIVNQALKSWPGARLIDIVTSLMAPEDWQMPAIREVRDGWVEAYDVPKNWLPTYKPSGDLKEDAIRNNMANMGDENTEGKGGILFFDELSRAHPKVQNSCLKIMDERKIGEAILGDKWIIMSAANRNVDDPESDIVFGNALSNRLSHVNFVPDFESWAEWAFGKVDQRIIDYIEINRDDFYTLDDEDTMGEVRTFASPRSWVKTSQNLAIAMQYAADDKGIKKLDRSRLMRAVGKDLDATTAEKITAFIKLLESFSPKDIKAIFSDPKSVKTPKGAGSGFSLSDAHALISAAVLSTKTREITPQEFENFSTYLAMLDNSSLASAAMKNLFKYHPYMHEELGERPGKDKFLKGYEIFDNKYKDAF